MKKIDKSWISFFWVSFRDIACLPACLPHKIKKKKKGWGEESESEPGEN